MTDHLMTAVVLSGGLAAGVALLVAIGFVRLALRVRGLVGHLARGVLLLHCAVFLRAAYRDLAPAFVPDHLWRVAGDPGAGLLVISLINLLAFCGGYHSLRALHLAIPEEDRARYSLLSAAFYPPWRASEATERDQG